MFISFYGDGVMDNLRENATDLAMGLLNFNLQLGCWFAGNLRNHFNINGKGNIEISMRQFQILMALQHHNVDNISGLENIFNISKSSLSLTISKMENTGLLYKEHYPEDKDRRTVHLRLTSKGEEITKKFFEAICISFTDFYGTLDDAQRENMKIGIEKLSKVFK